MLGKLALFLGLVAFVAATEDIGTQAIVEILSAIASDGKNYFAECNKDSEHNWEASKKAKNMTDFVECVIDHREDILEWFGEEEDAVVAEISKALHSILFGDCKVRKLAEEAQCGQPPQPIDCTFLGCIARAVSTADSCKAGHSAIMAVLGYLDSALNCAQPTGNDVQTTA